MGENICLEVSYRQTYLHVNNIRQKEKRNETLVSKNTGKRGQLPEKE